MRSEKNRRARTLVIAVAAGIVAAGSATAQDADREPVHIAQAFGLLGSGVYLGVNIDDIDQALAERLDLGEVYGVHVVDVEEDSPADAAGLEAGDVIRTWNGDRVESAAQLQRLVRETPGGRDVQLGVLRDGRQHELTVRIGERQNSFRVRAPGVWLREGGDEAFRDRLELRAPRMEFRAPDAVVRLDGFVNRGRLGVFVQSLGEQLADYFGVEGGVLVTEVREDTPAEAAGLQAGDVITGIAGDEVEDLGDLMEALSEQDEGDVEVRVVREGQARTLTATLEARQRAREGRAREGRVRGTTPAVWTTGGGGAIIRRV